MTVVISPQQDWRAYTIPWDLQPAPPWDIAQPPPPGWPWPPYPPVVYVPAWPNAPIAAGSLDPFKGWTAQMEPPTMRPAVPGLTS